MALPELRGDKVSNRVARRIAHDIAARHLTPGTPLLPEQSMAKEYGVGRSTVREALRLLEAQGLVTIRPGLGGGPLVGEPDGTDFGQTMTMYLQVATTPFRHVIDAVVALEGTVAATAAARVRQGDPVDLQPLIESSALDLRHLSSDAEVIATATGFHEAVRDLADNHVIGLVSAAVAHVFTERTLAIHRYHWDDPHRTVIRHAHMAIAKAIRSGNPARARQLAEEHMRSVAGEIKALYPGLADEIIEWR